MGKIKITRFGTNHITSLIPRCCSCKISNKIRESICFCFLLFFVFSVCEMSAFAEGDDQGYSYEYDEYMNNQSYTDESTDRDLPEPVVKGTYRLNFGIEDNDFIWKEANYLKAEGSWRYLFGEKRENTHDEAIFNRFGVSVDAPITEKLSFYTKVVVDPWSFVGKSEKINLLTDGGDPIEIQLKYWSNNRRTYPEIVYSQRGDQFALPELRVKDGMSESGSAFNIAGSVTPRLDIPELKIDKEFKPMKALWFDYKEDEYRFIVFLYAEQNIAMGSDDPLGLVNNHIMWEPSPWLTKWKPGVNYTATGFQKGTWDIPLQLRNSDGEWLSLLKAFRLEAEIASVHADFMIGSEMDPWDDYDEINNIPAALRLKKDITDNLMVGSVLAYREGYDDGSKDAVEQVIALDTAYIINEYHTLMAEVAVSEYTHDITENSNEQNEDSSAYKVLVGSEMDPFELPIWSTISYAYMGREFQSPLANYTYTKSDQQWGRHIWWHKRGDDEEQARIGNSIDKDRKVFGLDMRFGEFENIETYFNFRSVNRATDDEFVENVFRNETDYIYSDQLLFKFLFIAHEREKTTDGRSQDTFTAGAGVKYDFNKYVSLEETFERSNEYPEFPDRLYDWLTINPSAPYPYFYLTKTRLILTPEEWIEVGLDYTYNENQSAATLDDFLNYTGADIRLWLAEDLSARTVYRYSIVEDHNSQYAKKGHHNFYFDVIYELSDDATLVVQFGELGGYIEGLGYQSAVLDTQHRLEVLYKGTF